MYIYIYIYTYSYIYIFIYISLSIYIYIYTHVNIYYADYAMPTVPRKPRYASPGAAAHASAMPCCATLRYAMLGPRKAIITIKSQNNQLWVEVQKKPTPATHFAL